MEGDWVDGDSGGTKSRYLAGWVYSGGSGVMMVKVIHVEKWWFHLLSTFIFGPRKMVIATTERNNEDEG